MSITSKIKTALTGATTLTPATAREAYEAAKVAHKEIVARPPNVLIGAFEAPSVEQMLALKQHELDARRAYLATEHAHRLWGHALDAADAGGVDYAALAKDVAADVAAIEVARLALQAMQNAAFGRIEVARQQHAAYTSMRAAAGLPPPRAFPSPGNRTWDVVLADYAREATATAPTMPHDEQVYRLECEIQKLQALAESNARLVDEERARIADERERERENHEARLRAQEAARNGPPRGIQAELERAARAQVDAAAAWVTRQAAKLAP